MRCNYCLIRESLEEKEFCSLRCENSFLKWKTIQDKKISINKQGYKFHKKFGLYHRYVYSLHHNHKFKPYEVVHHIDGDKLNNEVINLIVMPSYCHDLLHSKQRSLKKIFTKEDCSLFVRSFYLDLDRFKELKKDLLNKISELDKKIVKYLSKNYVRST